LYFKLGTQSPDEKLFYNDLSRYVETQYNLAHTKGNKRNVGFALHVSNRFKVSLAKVHYDPTSFNFTGEYNEQSEDPSLLSSIKPFKIEVGCHTRPGNHIKEAQVGINTARQSIVKTPIN
jgi:hypothetical protein